MHLRSTTNKIILRVNCETVSGARVPGGSARLGLARPVRVWRSPVRVKRGRFRQGALACDSAPLFVDLRNIRRAAPSFLYIHSPSFLLITYALGMRACHVSRRQHCPVLQSRKGSLLQQQCRSHFPEPSLAFLITNDIYTNLLGWATWCAAGCGMAFRSVFLHVNAVSIARDGSPPT